MSASPGNSGPPDLAALRARLAATRDALPRRLQQVAAFALENPDEMAFGTASQIAGRAEVQPSTLVRFAQALGYSGFSELQNVFRARLREGWPDYRQRLDVLRKRARDPADAAHLLAGFVDSAAASLDQLRRTIDPRSLGAAVETLAAARRIYIVGQRRAFAVAHYLAYAFAKLDVDAALVDNVGSLGPEQAAKAGPGDAIIAISFSPYTPFTVEIAREANARGVPVVAVTDTAMSPLAPFAKTWFEVAESDFAAFRSMSATFCLAIALATAVANARTREAAKS